jgi:hypothetical protein
MRRKITLQVLILPGGPALTETASDLDPSCMRRMQAPPFALMEKK